MNQTLNSYTTDLTEGIRSNQAKVVGITIYRDETREERSGVIYSSNDQGTYILTSARGIKDATRLLVRFDNNAEFEPEIIGVDELTSVALLLTHPEFSADSIRIGNSNLVKQGEYIFSLSARNRGVGSGMAGFGIISSNAQLYHSLEQEEVVREGIFQTFVCDIIATDEMEGGPLFNASGDMIGLLTKQFSSPSINTRQQVVLSTSELQSIVQQLLENGEVTRHYLGVIGRDIESIEVYEKSAYNLALDTTDGVLVTEVLENSPAQAAGLQIGDVIHSINTIPITNLNDLRAGLYEEELEYPLSLSITRQMTQMNVSITND